MSPNGGWSKNNLKVLDEASEDDLYNLFKMDYESKQLSTVVRTCLQFEGVDGHQSIGQKARAALVRIGREGRLNAIRVKRYGISIDDVPAAGDLIPIAPVGVMQEPERR